MRATLLGLITVVLVLSAASALGAGRSTLRAALTATPDAGLPGRATPTPPLVATALPTPQVTSPFVLPTSPPTHSPTPARDCTAVFPLENVEAIALGRTTFVQLQAAFGRAVRERGRASYFRFESSGCVLRALIGVDEVLEVELRDYGTLGLLLAQYGEPAAVGISQGNMTLRDIGHAVLLFPEQGVTATFAARPEALTLTVPVTTLTFRPPFDAIQQLTRLNARLIPWTPPTLPTSTPAASEDRADLDLLRGSDARCKLSGGTLLRPHLTDQGCAILRWPDVCAPAGAAACW